MLSNNESMVLNNSSRCLIENKFNCSLILNNSSRCLIENIFILLYKQHNFDITHD